MIQAGDGFTWLKQENKGPYRRAAETAEKPKERFNTEFTEKGFEGTEETSQSATSAG